MSGRCRACDAVMSDEDMCRKFPPDEDGKRDFSDLCGLCHEEALAILFNVYKPQAWYMDCEEFGYKGILGISIDRSYE